MICWCRRSAEIVLEGFISPDPEHIYVGRPVQRIPRLLRRQQIAQAYLPRRPASPTATIRSFMAAYRRQSRANQRGQHLDAGDVLGDGLALPSNRRVCRISPACGAANGRRPCAFRFANPTAATRNRWPPRCGDVIWATTRQASSSSSTTISIFTIGKRSSGRFVIGSTPASAIFHCLPARAGRCSTRACRLEDRNSVKYGHGSWTRVLIDATINWQLQPQEQYGGNRYPAVGTTISNEMAEKLKKRWSEYGF